MNKAQAKREACFRAAMVIDNALAGGYDTLDKYGDDRPKVEDGLNELITELIRRGGRTS